MSKLASFALGLVRRQAFFEGRQVWCIYCFTGQAVPLSYRSREKRVHVVVRL